MGGEKKIPQLQPGDRFCFRDFSSDFHDFGRLKSFGSLLHLEFDGVAFFEGLVAFTHDGFEVDEHIFAACPFDEAVPFRSVEPLDASAFHTEHSLKRFYMMYSLLAMNRCCQNPSKDCNHPRTERIGQRTTTVYSELQAPIYCFPV